MRPIIPTRDLQRRVPTAGRLRMGVQVQGRNGKTFPKSIDTWRLTSENERAIRQAAQLYGGTPRPWTGDRVPAGQWEVITEAAELKVVLPPDCLGGTPCYEKWARSGCERRCDGEMATVQVSGPDGPEPAEVRCICDAKQQMECQVTTRLSVILLGVDFAGVWRLDTKSWHAAKELPGMVDAITMVQSSGMPRGLLAIEHREDEGGKKKYVVPSLRIAATPEELASGSASLGLTAGEMRGAALPAGEPQVYVEVHADTDPDDVFDIEETIVLDEDEPAANSGLVSSSVAEPVVPEFAEAAERPVSRTPPEASVTPPNPRAADDGGGVGGAATATDPPPARGVTIDGSTLRKVVIACGERARQQEVDSDTFRHAVVSLLTDGRTSSSKELAPDEAKRLTTLLSLFGSDLFAHAEGEGMCFIDSNGERVTTITWQGARPQVAPAPADAAGEAPPPAEDDETVDWAAVARAAGVSEAQLLMRARGVARGLGVSPPNVLLHVEPGGPLHRKLLEELEVSA